MLLMMSFSSCEKDSKDANVIVDRSIEVSGGELFKKSTIAFDFRGRRYAARRYGGGFSLSRLIINSQDSIYDVLDNNNFTRFVNGQKIELEDSLVNKLKASVNSVHYFSVLPYGLNDRAVNKTYLNEVEIKGRSYFKIKVTFNEDGGGEDFDDEFIYWIDNKNFKVDYLAYSYNENKGKGYRFREAYNERYLSGIRFVDYNNYKPRNNEINLHDLDILFEKNELDLLSKIELKNITVSTETTQ
jgi:hypothetical protein